MEKWGNLSGKIVYLIGVLLLVCATLQNINILDWPLKKTLTPQWIIWILVFFMSLAAILDSIVFFTKNKRFNGVKEKLRNSIISIIIEIAFVILVICNMIFA